MRLSRILIPAVLMTGALSFAACSGSSRDESIGQASQAAMVIPTPVPVRSTCESLGFANGCTIDPNTGNTCTVNGITVTILPIFISPGVATFEFRTTPMPINGVLVSSLVPVLYDYGPLGVSSDTGLILGPGALVGSLAPVSFCVLGAQGGVDGGAKDACTDAQKEDAAEADTGAEAIASITLNGTTIFVAQFASFTTVVATGTVLSSGPVSLAASINWGDNTTSTGTVTTTSLPSFDVRGTHTYFTGGTKAVTVTVTDQNSGVSATVTSTASVLLVGGENHGGKGSSCSAGSGAAHSD